MSINLTVVIDNDEAIRKFRELQKTAKTVTSSVVTDADRMDIAMRRLATTLGQIGVGVSLVASFNRSKWPSQLCSKARKRPMR